MYGALEDIVIGWRGSMVNLALPQSFGITLTLYHPKPNPILLNQFVGTIGRMPNLKYLHVGNWKGEMSTKLQNIRSTRYITILKHLFPTLTINMSPAADGSPHDSSSVTWGAKKNLHRSHRISTRLSNYPSTILHVLWIKPCSQSP